MSQSKLYPEPPHLTIAVYPAEPEQECFAAVCGLVERLGCQPGGVLEVAPWEAEFELRSDLAGRSSIVDVGRADFHRIAAGGDPSARPVRAGYRAKRGGVVVVEYLAAPRGSRHPIAVSTAAGALGLPVELWGKTERGAAARSVRWALDVLREITAHCAVFYGGIDVEDTLATPEELASGLAVLPSEVFLSRRVAAGVREALAEAFRAGATVEWPAGWFFSAWGPFHGRKVTVPPSPAQFSRAGRLLGRAVLDGAG